MLLQLQGYAMPPPPRQMGVPAICPGSGAMDLAPGVLMQQQPQTVYSVGAPGILLGAAGQQPLASVATSSASGGQLFPLSREHLAGPGIDVLRDLSQTPGAPVPLASPSQDGAATAKRLALAAPSATGDAETRNRSMEITKVEPKTYTEPQPTSAATTSTSTSTAAVTTTPATAPQPAGTPTPRVLVSERRAGISAVNVHLAMSGRQILQACRGRGAQLSRAAPNEGSLSLSIHPPGEAPPVPPAPPKTAANAPRTLTPAVPCVTVCIPTFF